MSARSYLKYIMVEGDAPIIFPVTLTHKDVAGKMDITSAGFVAIEANEDGDIFASAYGESISLDKRSLPETDSRIITEMLNEEDV